MPFDNWLISDLIPKKSQKCEFRKHFVTIFSVSKPDPKKKNFPKFDLFRFLGMNSQISKYMLIHITNDKNYI